MPRRTAPSQAGPSGTPLLKNSSVLGPCEHLGTMQAPSSFEQPPVRKLPAFQFTPQRIALLLSRGQRSHVRQAPWLQAPCYAHHSIVNVPGV